MTDETNKMGRREFLGITSMAGAATLITGAAGINLGLVQVAGAATGSAGGATSAFTFAMLSDAHLFSQANHRFDAFLEEAVEDVNKMNPLPDFVVYPGDIAQNGTRDQLEKGKRILSKLKMPMHVIPGEHDWYLDLGAAWRDLFGSPTWSFDHKGVHFIGLNSILVRDFWTAKKLTPEQRMGVMEELEGHVAGLWGVRGDQLAWLEKDVAGLAKNTPVVVFTHTPLWDYYKRWGFATDDGAAVRKILSKFDKVQAYHGHVHQVVYNKVGNMSSIGCMSTSWPWPYPDDNMPFPEIRMMRSAPGDFKDGMGSQFVNLEKDFTGKANFNSFSDNLSPAAKRGVKV